MYLPCSQLPPLVGYALLFNRPSGRRENGRRLQFPGYAFDRFLACSSENVYACLDHEGETVMFASTSRGTLLIDADSRGLFIIAIPQNDTNGRIACSLVRGGYVAHMSAYVRFPRARVTAIGDLDIVKSARITEVSGTDSPSIPKTSLFVVGDEQADVPRTVETLLAEDCRLREANLNHTKAGTLAAWKQQKAAERCALLRAVIDHNQLATAG